MSCGYTWPQIDAMTFPAYLELAAYWRICPPTHVLMKSFVGFKGG
jgi:hypothetical protein